MSSKLTKEALKEDTKVEAPADDLPLYHSKIKYLPRTTTTTASPYQFPNFTPMKGGNSGNPSLEPQNAKAELMNILMGFEISTLRPEPSLTGTPFAIFNPASTSAE